MVTGNKKLKRLKYVEKVVKIHKQGKKYYKKQHLVIYKTSFAYCVFL